MKEFKYDIEEIEAAARWLMEVIGARRVILFDAPMGAGKTTLISAVAKLLGSEDDPNSPTFSIVNEYSLPDNKTIYHFDLYRLETQQAVADIGFRDYMESGNLCFIEWPKVALPLLPYDAAVMRIEVNPDGSRTLQLLN